IPAAAHLASFRLERVDQPEFFGGGPAGIVRLQDGKIPRGSMVEVETRTVNPVGLRELVFPGVCHSARPAYEEETSRSPTRSKPYGERCPQPLDPPFAPRRAGTRRP